MKTVITEDEKKVLAQKVMMECGIKYHMADKIVSDKYEVKNFIKKVKGGKKNKC